MTIYHDLVLSWIDPIARQHHVVLTKGVGSESYAVDFNVPLRTHFQSDWLYKHFLELTDEVLCLDGFMSTVTSQTNLHQLIDLISRVRRLQNREVDLMYPTVINPKHYYNLHPRKKFTFGTGKYAPLTEDDEQELMEILDKGGNRKGRYPLSCGIVTYEFVNYWNCRSPEHLKMHEDVVYMYDRNIIALMMLPNPGNVAVTKRKDGVTGIILPNVYIRRHHNIWTEHVIGKEYPDKFTPMKEFNHW